MYFEYFIPSKQIKTYTAIASLVRDFEFHFATTISSRAKM